MCVARSHCCSETSAELSCNAVEQTARQSDLPMQVEGVRADVLNISAAVQANLSSNSNFDFSDLTSAERTLNNTVQDAQDLQDKANSVLHAVQVVIYVLGAAAFAVGIWGVVTLLARVRFHPCR